MVVVDLTGKLEGKRIAVLAHFHSTAGTEVGGQLHIPETGRVLIGSSGRQCRLAAQYSASGGDGLQSVVDLFPLAVFFKVNGAAVDGDHSQAVGEKEFLLELISAGRDLRHNGGVFRMRGSYFFFECQVFRLLQLQCDCLNRQHLQGEGKCEENG